MTLGFRNVCCVTKSNNPRGDWLQSSPADTLLVSSIETKATQCHVGPSCIASTIRTGRWVNFSDLHILISNSSSHFTDSDYFLQPISNLHASLWNIPEQEMADCHVPNDTVSVSRAYTYSNHVVWIVGEKSQGQGQGQGLRCQGQGQDLHGVSSMILEAKARPRGQQDWF